MRLSKNGLISRIVLAGGLALLLLGLAYLAQKSLLDRSDTIDFKSIWLAGDLWSKGTNPYSDAYTEIGDALFVGLNRPHAWFYPPNWWPLAIVSSSAEYTLSGQIWRAFNGLLLVGTCLLFWQRLTTSLPEVGRGAFIAMGVFASTASATAFTLALGQTSILIMLGVTLFVTSWLSRNRWMMVIALIILALKPTVGLPLAGLLIVSTFWWPALIGSGIFVLLSALQPFLLHGTGNVLSLMLQRIGEYGQYQVNFPPSTTGLRNLFHHIAGVDLSTIPLTLAALVLCALIGWKMRNESAAPQRAIAAGGAIALVVAVVPLHTYDAVILVPLVPLLVLLPRVLLTIGAACVFLIWRVNNVADVSGLSMPGETYFTGSMLVSLAALGLVISFGAGMVLRQTSSAVTY